MRHELHMRAVAAALAATAASASAQGAVAGRVSLVEAGGARSTDLANAVVWLEPLDGAPPASPVAMQISMEGRRFRPAVRVATPRSTVAFPNDDPFRHNVFSDAGPERFDLGLYGRGQSKQATFGKPGVYPIYCNIHARMVAYVVVAPSRWFAQAATDGSYRIANVPNGRYRLHAWHDRGGERAQELVVSAAGPAAADVQLDARGWKPAVHKNKFGHDYPPETRDRY